jgi:t-SNARE complex subunit (syntaxin)
VTWPQLYVLAAMILSSVIGIASEARRRDKTAGYVACYVIIVLAIKVVMALVLHAGGFW